MSSYAKRMMEVAAEWKAANPGDGPLRLIRRSQSGVDADSARADRVLADPLYRKVIPAKDRAEFERLHLELKAAQLSIKETENELESAINLLEEIPRQGKIVHEDALELALGRWCLQWAKDGYNVFELAASFTAALLLTDASNVDFENVRMPFQGLLLQIPPGFAKGSEGDSYTKLHVFEVEAQDSGPSLLRHSRLSIQATDGMRILDMVVNSNDLRARGWDAIEDLPVETTDDVDQMARHTLCQLVFGMLAYLSAVRGALEPRVVERKPGKKKSQSPRPIHWEVGRTITIDPRLIRAAQAGGREIAFELKHRHIVRGHYRNQAHGVRHLERRRQWIAPFWKGPEEGAKLTHVYRLETPTS